jgi:hypothetical protein
MTVNFSGIKNAGAIKYAKEMEHGLLSTTEELSNQKIWAKLTNENGNDLDEFKPLLERCPDKDDFVRIDFSAKSEPLERSFISINDKVIKFKDIPTEDIPLVTMVKKLLTKIADPNKELEMDEHYIESKKAFDNTAFDGWNDFSVKDMIEIVGIAHEPVLIKDDALEGVNTLNKKLYQALSD